MKGKRQKKSKSKQKQKRTKGDRNYSERVKAK